MPTNQKNESKPKMNIISIKDLSFEYDKNQIVLQKSSLEIKKGDIAAIAGESGCGKTTLCYILKGLIPHEIKGNLSGTIHCAGVNIKKTKISEIAKKVGMVFQDLDAQIFSNTVLEEVQFGLKNLGMDPSLAIDALKRLSIGHLKERIPMNLSAGQKQRVILASVIALQPEILILDEPSIHLDPKSKIQLRDWLAKLNKKNDMTIIIASNDPYLIGELCNKMFFIQNGIIEGKKKDELMEKVPSWQWKYYR